METIALTMADKLAKYYRDAQVGAEVRERILKLEMLLSNRQRFIDVAEADTENNNSGIIEEAARQCNSITNELLLLRQTENVLSRDILDFEREAAARD